MYKFSKIFSLILVSALAVTIVNAFGPTKDSSEILNFMGMPALGLFVGVGLLVLMGVLFLFFFWFLMLIDCLKRDFKKDNEKLVWVLVILFLQMVGALLYYFIVKVQDKKNKKK